MTIIRLCILTILLTTSIKAESTEAGFDFMKTFFAEINGKVKGIIDDGMQTVDKVNAKIKTFAKSGQIMLDENLPDNNDIANFFRQSVTGTPFEISMNVFHAFCKFCHLKFPTSS